MSNISIQVKNLGKKYTISHQQERYTALRDVIINKVKGMGKQKGPQKKEDFWAVRDMSFSINEGDRIGIVGRNGAGKSTLLKLLSRITSPTTGNITVKGRVASLLEVGTGFHPELTGRENIYMNGAILGMTKNEIKSRFDEIVQFAEVERFLDTPVKRYSSGMYVRLAFSVAAHLQPDVLIIDEVLAVGDAQFQKKCLGKMSEYGKSGRTILFVSHNLTAVRSLCDKAIYMQNGTLSRFDKVENVIKEYTSAFMVSQYCKVWEGDLPGNQSMSLRSVSVCDVLGNPLQYLTTDDEFYIEFDYQVNRDNAYCGFALLLFDLENNIVLSSISNNETEWYGKPMKAGVYKTRCRIPANLLNDKRYNIGFNIFSQGFSDVREFRNIMTIEIQDGLEVRRDFYGEYGGNIRPLFDWHTQCI